jgi:hypothetical protein
MGAGRAKRERTEGHARLAAEIRARLHPPVHIRKVLPKVFENIGYFGKRGGA